MIDLGPEQAFQTFPAPVEIDGQSYFLVRDGVGYQLLSSVCPHQGGTVVATDTGFECPQHGWRFSLQTGRCLSGPSAQLTGIPVTVRAGRLAVDPATTLPAAAAGRTPAAWPADFRIRLAGHASLEIRCGGFTLLTDPWLVGPAFLGAWMTYPGSGIDPATLRPDAIWISHEHSDHFHKPTLEVFRRDTPVFVPDFPNRRLVHELAAMGFTRVTAMRFGEPLDIGSGFQLTCFEPPGLWNDSVVLIEAGPIRVLNINDAGVNHRIASLVGPVDILTSSFSPASSYPHAWDHLSAEAKGPIVERARLGCLRLLHQAVKRYQPRYLIPFASHFVLWHPSHRDYMAQMRRNTLDDVLRAFERSPVPVIDLLPGGWWEPATGTIDHGPDRAGLYDPDRVRRWLDDTFDQATFDRHHPAAGPLDRDEVAAHFLRLNDVPDIVFCPDLTVNVLGTKGQDVAIDLSFEIVSGRLSILPARPAVPNLTMQLPVNVLRHLVRSNASWDEAHVGFWCRFTRTPDVFSADFWRLLQAPYFVRPAAPARRAAPGDGIAIDVTITELIERFGAPAERILSRYGLHCVGCPHAPAESLRLAAHRHGVEAASTDRLLRELNVALQ